MSGELTPYQQRDRRLRSRRAAPGWRQALLEARSRNKRQQVFAEYLASPEWEERREAALERAEHRCQLCNRGGELRIHRRTNESLGDERPEDLTVLCPGCANRHAAVRRVKV